MKLLTLMCAALCLAGSVLAGEARPLAEDPVVEQRMIAISEELRCLVCQNESLAGLARRAGRRFAPRNPHHDPCRQIRH